MDKILVTTDLSTNSKAGLRFAINWASEKKAQLIFLHVNQVLRAATWTDEKYDHVVAEDKKKMKADLEAFVAGVYKAMKVTPGKYKCEVFHSLAVSDSISYVAEEKKCTYICIATRGAGKVNKIFGTHTASLIKNSEVPVMCIPSSYRTRPLNKVLYASDMTNYANELKKVVGLAKSFNAKLELLHLSFPFEYLIDEDIAEKELKKKFKYDIDLHYEKRDIEHTLLQDLDAAVQKSKPSLVVMFTDQKRSFFERLFLSSKSAEFSFSTKAPLLIFNKRSAK